MSISKITKDLQGQNNKFPPVHKWNPELCDGQEFYINREGDWFYNKSPIKNTKLVNLFSTVLRKDKDDYFLVTPVEKVPVKVELAPYKIIDYLIQDDLVTFITNLNYEFKLNNKNTTKLIKYEGSSIPIVHVRDNIEGFLGRNTYYNLINFALENKYIDKDFLYLPSKNIKHIIGKID